MYGALMATFAAVVAVVALGGLVLLMSRVVALTRGLDYRIDQVSEKVRQNSNAALRVELDGLVGALDAIRASNRQELGRIWGRLGGKPSERTIDAAPFPTNGAANDDSFASMLALQSAPPVKPE